MKNLFKQHYPVVKRELRNFNETCSRLSKEFENNMPGNLRVLEERLENAKWHMVICKYLDLCRDEEKKFIDLLYFQKNSLIDVSIIFPLSLRSCHEWREKTLKNLLLMAARDGLLEIC